MGCPTTLKVFGWFFLMRYFFYCISIFYYFLTSSVGHILVSLHSWFKHRGPCPYDQTKRHARPVASGCCLGCEGLQKTAPWHSRSTKGPYPMPRVHSRGLHSTGPVAWWFTCISQAWMMLGQHGLLWKGAIWVTSGDDGDAEMSEPARNLELEVGKQIVAQQAIR